MRLGQTVPESRLGSPRLKCASSTSRVAFRLTETVPSRGLGTKVPRLASPPTSPQSTIVRGSRAPTDHRRRLWLSKPAAVVRAAVIAKVTVSGQPRAAIQSPAPYSASPPCQVA
jgi:hypothetical protein